jgi:hypothetical protein
MPGVVTAIAAWMLDTVVCAGMATIGEPCVSVSALLDLHHLLIERGFRRSSQDDPNIVQGSNMRNLPAPAPPATAPRQLSMALDSVRLRGMSSSERRALLARLAGVADRLRFPRLAEPARKARKCSPSPTYPQAPPSTMNLLMMK